MFKLWLLSANKPQLGWADLIFSHRFSARRLKLHRPRPLYIKASPPRERHFWMHPMCAAASRGSWFCVPDCELWQTSDYETGFYLNAPKPDTNELSQSHMAASKATSFPVLPPTFSLPFCLSCFHPLLMCDTLILNILFPVFWSIGFTCRWVGNLHRLKGLPSLLMLSDNGVSIHPLC